MEYDASSNDSLLRNEWQTASLNQLSVKGLSFLLNTASNTWNGSAQSPSAITDRLIIGTKEAMIIIVDSDESVSKPVNNYKTASTITGSTPINHFPFPWESILLHIAYL